MVFKLHFENLAKESVNSQFDESYHKQVKCEVDSIIHIVDDIPVEKVTMSEFKKSLKTIHKGKAADIFGLNVEHIMYGPELLQTNIINIINSIFEIKSIPSCLKMGILSPVFKNMGHLTNVGNYRGITVLPTICKVIETVIRNRIQPNTLSQSSSSIS